MRGTLFILSGRNFLMIIDKYIWTMQKMIRIIGTKTATMKVKWVINERNTKVWLVSILSHVELLFLSKHIYVQNHLFKVLPSQFLKRNIADNLHFFKIFENLMFIKKKYIDFN